MKPIRPDDRPRPRRTPNSPFGRADKDTRKTFSGAPDKRRTNDKPPSGKRKPGGQAEWRERAQNRPAQSNRPGAARRQDWSDANESSRQTSSFDARRDDRRSRGDNRQGGQEIREKWQDRRDDRSSAPRREQRGRHDDRPSQRAYGRSDRPRATDFTGRGERRETGSYRPQRRDEQQQSDRPQSGETRSPKASFGASRGAPGSPFGRDWKRSAGPKDKRREAKSFRPGSKPALTEPSAEFTERRPQAPREHRETPSLERSPQPGDQRTERARRDRQRKPQAQVAHEPGTIMVDRRAALRLRTGNPWVYRSDIVSAEGVSAGALAPVLDERGRSLGTALYSDSSQIALRLISNEPVAGDQLLDLIRQRIRAAAGYRDRVVEGTNAYRVVFSEADQIPGLIVDRYNDVLSIQVLTQAMDREDIRQTVMAELGEVFSPAGIIERVEPRIRELEQLPARESGLISGKRSATTFTMNGLQFQFDALSGQKTGAFLDQRENYLAAARYARGKALDVCCYQGGFSLHLARVCDKVTGVDISRAALETAEQNEALNREAFDGREIEWMEANAFDLLRDYADAGRRYDTIVLDPPAFAKTKKTLETAMRGYKEMNLRAFKMLQPGGTLVTCSCSFHVSETDFLQMLTEAAADAHRTVRVIEKRMQAKDHPVLLALPESQYLKCVIAMVE
ncbi:MAG TPA: class I SAM-dependent methyltransferase [Terriglobales bacterium]|nr:class I SAM-dependent methyltransferase [Terriglobales bacterium]